jgi:hypothetical protein
MCTALLLVTTKPGGSNSSIFFHASKKSTRAFGFPTQGWLKTFVGLDVACWIVWNFCSFEWNLCCVE